MQLILDIPEKYFFQQSVEKFGYLLKLNTAIDLYKNGHFSAGAAVEFIGGINREQFLYECYQKGVEPQTYENIEELQAEIEILDQNL